MPYVHWFLNFVIFVEEGLLTIVSAIHLVILFDLYDIHKMSITGDVLMLSVVGLNSMALPIFSLYGVFMWFLKYQEK